jgi:uncharacterized protein YrrD
MRRSAKQFLKYQLTATDGVLGKVADFYFDDYTWAIRYLVADTGKWLPGRQVLISPQSVGKPDDVATILPVSLTKGQVEASPSIDADRPVSRQHEAELAEHFGWAVYWGSPVVPGAPAPIPKDVTEQGSGEAHGDPDLRSVHEVLGYRIQAADQKVGHVEDFILDTDSWVIRYLVVDTRDWLPGRKVLVSPGWVQSVNWDEKRVHVNLAADAIKNSPEFCPNQPVNREYEDRLYDYYGRRKYWEKGDPTPRSG